ncbi:unnamed protein product [Aureobasidium vineae]|uniref:Extracellular membrane protein CFEM domain-containing protein n=1 Tax=Aureobasidium vineae TaxID=2773715 RepID=A0A9N8P4J2_9PEZI|nr:unnamed protein product [Aureobasidium vineae]
MRAFHTAILSTLFVAMSHKVQSQDCDLVDQQACCYVEADSGSDTSYCCNGSIVGNPGSSNASALNDLTCCQDDGRTGISVGFDITTCKAGSATPLTAKGTAASTVADVIKSISASRSASRESLYSSASVSRASAAAASASMTSTGEPGTLSSSSGSTGSSSSSVSRSQSGSSSSAIAAGTTSSSGSAAAVTSSPTSTGGVAMMTMDVLNAAMAGGLALCAAVL